MSEKSKEKKRLKKLKEQEAIANPTVEEVVEEEICKTEDCVHTFVEYAAECPELTELKALINKAFDNFEYKFKNQCESEINDWFKMHPSRNNMSPKEYAELMDVVGNSISITKKWNETPILIVTQLQLMMRFKSITTSLKVEESYHSLPQEKKNTFILNVFCTKMGACLLHVRNEQNNMPSLAAVGLNQGCNAEFFVASEYVPPTAG